MRIHEVVEKACEECGIERSGLTAQDLKAVCAELDVEYSSAKKSAEEVARQLDLGDEKSSGGGSGSADSSNGAEAASKKEKGKEKEKVGEKRGRDEALQGEGGKERRSKRLKAKGKAAALEKERAEHDTAKRVAAAAAAAAAAFAAARDIEIRREYNQRLAAEAASAAAGEQKMKVEVMDYNPTTRAGPSRYLYIVKPSDRLGKFFRMLEKKLGTPMDELRFFHREAGYEGRLCSSRGNSTFAAMGIIDGDAIDVFREQSGDIGIFGRHRGAPGLSLLTSRGPEVASAAALEELVRSLPPPPFLAVAAGRGELADLDRGYGYSAHEDAALLDVGERRVLLSELESKFEANEGGEVSEAGEQQPVDTRRDFKLYLERSQLEAMLGARGVLRLEAFYAAKFGLSASRLPSLKYALRRCWAHGECIDFHRDYAKRTMQVALNDDFEGGDLLFISRCKAGLTLVRPRRPAGSATCHDWTIPHGVATLVSGTRCGLFLLES